MPITSFPENATDTKFIILLLSLHVLALIQHFDVEPRNAKTLADLLSNVPGEEIVSEKQVMKCFETLKEMGFPVCTEQGSRRVCLDKELSADEMIEVLLYYMNAAVEEMGIRDCFRSYVKKNSSK